MLKHQYAGFTLTELQLALAMTALLSMGMMNWSTSFQGRMTASENTTQAAAYYWLHWLWNDLLNSTRSPDDWQFQPEHECLLYADVGVRVKDNALQWRPANAQCADRGWQGLNDTQLVRFKRVYRAAESKLLCLEFAAPATPHTREQACLPWPLS
ncbi:MAG: pilin protein [Idiomarinaceae bacterium HL-53]|nr:MAG: pilin protein [Idiomarinaceae bacterium HL-53]CUS47179.1 hypothetical protein Ga0003345_0105 [Idiomarinaceae bacterium HL-53]